MNLSIYKLDVFTNTNNIILITGYSNSGKTTLAKKISELYNFNYIELDIIDPLCSFKICNEDTNNVSFQVLNYLNNETKIFQQNCLDFHSVFNEIVQFCQLNPNKTYIIEGIQIYKYWKEKTVNFSTIIINEKLLVCKNRQRKLIGTIDKNNFVIKNKILLNSFKKKLIK